MKITRSTICRASLAFLLGTAMAMPLAQAQHNQTVARATVPFAFQYGPATLPAGEYSFGMLSDNIMTVHGPGRSALALVSRGEAKPVGPGKLVFHRDGAQVTLQEVYVPQMSARLRCPVKKQRKQADLAVAKPADTDIEVALLEGGH